MSRVACGIFVGFILNLCFSQARNENLALALILGAPVVPSIVLLCVLIVCPESPRYYLRRGPNYNPTKAYEILKTLRRCRVSLSILIIPENSLTILLVDRIARYLSSPQINPARGTATIRPSKHGSPDIYQIYENGRIRRREGLHQTVPRAFCQSTQQKPSNQQFHYRFGAAVMRE